MRAAAVADLRSPLFCSCCLNCTASGGAITSRALLLRYLTAANKLARNVVKVGFEVQIAKAKPFGIR